MSTVVWTQQEEGTEEGNGEEEATQTILRGCREAVYMAQIFASNCKLLLWFGLCFDIRGVLAPLKLQTFKTGFQSVIF